MTKFSLSKAFTMIELMVSIFITITIIASFYKLYNASVKHERSSSIRVVVNITGEQMLDTIAEAVRLIGLNNSKTDFTGEGGTPAIIYTAGENNFVFRSPFGSVITKVKTISDLSESGTFPKCQVTLFNSAAYYSGINKLYFHNQDGSFKATLSLGLNANGMSAITGDSTFEGAEYNNYKDQYKDQPCKSIFPNGSIVSGEDFKYTLQYFGGKTNSLTLSCERLDGSSCGNLIDFHFDGDENTNSKNYLSMPKFVIEYLVEDCSAVSGDCTRTWEATASSVKGIVAVRFGFILLSKKERVYAGNDTDSNLPKYCIFSDKFAGMADDHYCYPTSNENISFNYTASVFRRVVYLSNYRLLKDQIN